MADNKEDALWRRQRRGLEPETQGKASKRARSLSFARTRQRQAQQGSQRRRGEAQMARAAVPQTKELGETWCSR